MSDEKKQESSKDFNTTKETIQVHISTPSFNKLNQNCHGLILNFLPQLQVRSDDPPIDPHSQYQAGDKNKDRSDKPVVDEKILEMVRLCLI